MDYFYSKITVILIAVLIVLSSCSEGPEQNAESFIENARSFIAQNQKNAAIIEYKNAIKVDQENDTACFELAETYVTIKELSKAVKYYNLAIKINPDNTDAHLRLGQIYLQTGQLLDAKEHVLKVLEIIPSSVPAHHILSGVQIKERNIGAAIETLNKATLIDNQDIKTYLSLAQLYMKIGETEKAEKSYMSAIALDHSYRQAYMGLANLYGFQKKWDKIETLLIGLLKMDGPKTQKYTDLARFYEGRQRYELAEGNFKNAVDQDIEQVVPLLNLAEFYTKRNKKEDAVSTMEKALVRHGKNPLIHVAFSKIYLQFGLVDQASESIDTALGMNRRLTDALFQKGRVLMAQNDYKRALDTFDQVISLDKINAKAYYYRAICINKRGGSDRPEQKIFRAAAGMLENPEKFEEDQIKGNLLAAITVNPRLLDARIKLTEIYILEKDSIKAREQIQEIFRYSKPNIKTMTLLSGIYLLENDLKEAERILTAIVDQQKDYLPAKIRLGLLYKRTGRNSEALNILKSVLDTDPEQRGIVKIMTDIYLSENDYGTAISLVDSMIGDNSDESIAFYENLKGEIYIKNSIEKKALVHFSNAKQLKPDFIEPHMYIAEIYRKQGQYSESIKEYQAVETIKKNYLPALVSLGMMFDLTGDAQNGEVYYRKVLAIDSRHVDAANNLAFILSERPEQLEEAFRLAKFARERRPRDPNVLDTMGWVFYQKGSYLNALSELKESLELNPGNALACYHYGMALYRTKEYEQARKYFKKALKIDPNFKDADATRRILN